MNIIEQFIEDNGLDFSGSGSELNSNCCILSGFALYKGLDWDSLIDIDIIKNDFSLEAYQELERVFEFAEKKNYGAIWETEAYKSKYTY